MQTPKVFFFIAFYKTHLLVFFVSVAIHFYFQGVSPEDAGN